MDTRAYRLGLVAACGLLGVSALLLFSRESGREERLAPRAEPEPDAPRPGIDLVAPARTPADRLPVSVRETLAAEVRATRRVRVETEADADLEDDVEVALHGTVVDLGGGAVEGAQVKVFSLAAPGEVSCGSSTDAAGEFLVEELRRGPHRLLVQGRFASSAPLDLVLGEGRNEAGPILLPAAASAGALRGRLVAEDGGDDPMGVVVLREVASGKEFAVTTSWSLFASEADGVASFAIEGLPAGEYELSLVPLDGRRYQPATVRAAPPEEGLEFRARSGPRREVALRVLDGATREELDDHVALVRLHGQWLPGESEGWEGCDRWVAYAEGYRPARGDFSRARPVVNPDGEDCERLEVEVALEPGHGLAVLFKDIESDRLLAPEFEDLVGPGVKGVTVLADGEPLARSDSDGLAVLALPRASAQLSFDSPGWRVVGEQTVEGVLFVHLAHE